MEVTGLKPDTVYFFFLAAGNQVGFGKSVKLKIKTSRDFPIGKYQNKINFILYLVTVGADFS